MNVGKVAGIALCLLLTPAIQGCLGVAATMVAHDRRTTGTYIDDQLIGLKISAAIAEDERMRKQTHINATSFNGFVLLTGEAPGESLRNRAAEIARSIPTVRVVQNEIVLRAPSSLFARAIDSVVTGKVKAALLEDKEINAAQVKVVTERGVVYLMGLLTHAEADRVAKITRHVVGVQQVVKAMEYIR